MDTSREIARQEQLLKDKARQHEARLLDLRAQKVAAAQTQLRD